MDSSSVGKGMNRIKTVRFQFFFCFGFHPIKGRFGSFSISNHFLKNNYFKKKVILIKSRFQSQFKRKRGLKLEPIYVLKSRHEKTVLIRFLKQRF